SGGMASTTRSGPSRMSASASASTSTTTAWVDERHDSGTRPATFAPQHQLRVATAKRECELDSLQPRHRVDAIDAAVAVEAERLVRPVARVGSSGTPMDDPGPLEAVPDSPAEKLDYFD